MAARGPGAWLGGATRLGLGLDDSNDSEHYWNVLGTFQMPAKMCAGPHSVNRRRPTHRAPPAPFVRSPDQRPRARDRHLLIADAHQVHLDPLAHRIVDRPMLESLRIEGRARTTGMGEWTP